MINLPEMPQRVARLPKDDRGYPVPAFVQWMFDGKPAVRGGGAKPDFRIANADFRARAFKQGLCWVCGDPLGVHRVYAIGPMCVINKTTAEPASHRDCVEYAVKACPFLVKPRMRRLPREDGEAFHVGGVMIERNPGVVCLYETREAKAFNTPTGWLIRLGAPDRVDWWAEGRQATRAEIMASIEGGYPLLLAEAEKEGLDALGELAALTGKAMQLLPAA